MRKLAVGLLLVASTAQAAVRVITTPRGGTRTIRYGEFVPADRLPDTRPDPEDTILTHADAVKAVMVTRPKPVQIVRGRWPGTLPTIPANFDAWVDVYDSPRAGYGFTVVYETLRGGKTYRRTVNYGIEGMRDSDWSEFVEPTIPPAAPPVRGR